MELFIFTNGMFKKINSLADFFPVSDGTQRIISVVGAGGKTTTVYHLAEELRKKGEPALITTTTHMRKPASAFVDWSQTERKKQIQALLDCGETPVTGLLSHGRRISSIPHEDKELFSGWGWHIIAEADGSAGYPVKVPRAHEPVLFPGTDTVIGVIGADALGRPLSEKAHHPEIISKFLRKSPDDKLTPEDITCLLKHPHGLFKYAENRNKIFILNKVPLDEEYPVYEKTALLLQNSWNGTILYGKKNNTN